MSRAPTSEEYSSLKQQYDQLLDKNQNDLIKIKQKERNLNEQLQKMKREGEEKQNGLTARIRQLQGELEKEKLGRRGDNGELNVEVKVKSEKKIEELQIDVRRLMDQNITLTADINSLSIQNQEQRLSNEKLVLQVERLTNYLKSMEADMKKLQDQSRQATANALTMTIEPHISQAQLASLQEEISKKSSQMMALKQQNMDLRALLDSSQEEAKNLQHTEKRYVKMLKKKESELSVMEGEISKLKMVTNKRKKTEVAQGECPKCSSMRQEVELLKQMVKSTQGMVRVKEIENSKYKMHNGEETLLNHSKSLSKHHEKGTTPLPPLRKK